MNVREIILAFFFLGIITLMFSSCKVERKIEPRNMPFWEIVNEQGQSSFLLGTSEYLPKDSARFLFNEQIIAAFDSAKVFITQIDVPNSDFGNTKMALEIPGEKIMVEYLSEAQFAKLSQLRKNWKYSESKSVPSADSSRLKLLFYLHDMIYFNNQENFYFDKFWMERAMPMAKQIAGLETYDSYYESFSVVNDSQVFDFMYSIESIDKFVDSLRNTSQELYMKGRFEKLHSLYLSLFPYLQSHFHELVGNKHKDWAKAIGFSVDSTQTFVTVDAFHMFGNNNLIDKLLSEGYEVKRIQ